MVPEVCGNRRTIKKASRRTSESSWGREQSRGVAEEGREHSIRQSFVGRLTAVARGSVQ